MGSAWLAIPIVVLLGAAIGALNGVLVAVFRYQSVIATLCTFFVLAGVIAKIAPAPKTAPAGTWLTGLGDTVGPVPGGLLLVAAPLVVWWLLSRTAFHRNLYAVGGNDATAFSAGIDVTADARARLQPRRRLRRRRRRRADRARAARRRRPASRSTR